ncbi:hypothetical protein HAPAU_12960 [Halalkalicoccus paucihalophilus]|uniref:Uncharacterized protein n=1 Tax=Halalkalicoccus paucihalophilus TaxID=1008153 RepID=A0A151AEW2_9EURY|nr:hypothetical protein [Halalkalicoccus paucihalophilus]KYH26201.1 hypothetical protein HAPAU_12960 [Halalkalicoccus paucihalophilus]
MSDEDPAYARRPRTEGGRARAIDGGAVAAGLCFGVFAVFVSTAGPLSAGFRLSFTALCLFCGGLVAGYLTHTSSSGAVQGVAVVLGTAGLMVAVSVSMTYGIGSLSRVPLVLAYETLSTAAFVAFGLLALCFGALSGELGVRLRG